MSTPQIILASTSAYRREALSRIGLNAECIPPRVDETPRPGESAANLARRLSAAKARAVAAHAGPDAIVIGADQVGELDGAIVGKPGSAAGAYAQLTQASGRELLFHSGLAVCCGSRIEESITLTRVRMRTLDASTISRYLERDQPYDCAGSFKCESLGITLFSSCDSSDPSALYGLPLIALTSALETLGVSII